MHKNPQCKSGLCLSGYYENGAWNELPNVTFVCTSIGPAFHAVFMVTPNFGALTNNSKKCRKSLLLLVIKLLDERVISALQHVT